MSDLPVPVVGPPGPPEPPEPPPPRIAAEVLDGLKSHSHVCENCHAELSGEYCARCGQRHEPHIHTVAHFAGEAFESISHADSRLWRTLWYLLARPGFLTREFFAGRRVAYLPPFRLYLVISVLFFLVVTVPQGPLYEADEQPDSERIEVMKDAARELEKSSGPGSDALKQAAADLKQQAEKESAQLATGEPAVEQKEGLQDKNGMTLFCDEFQKADPTASRNYAKLRAACLKISEDSGTELGKTIVHNIPRAMFVFLPLLALVMKPLYWRPRRYYVEHLLFLIHNHAFVFLVLAMIALLEMIPVVGQHLGVVKFAAWLYIIWYLFRAMRVVYAQGRGLTIAKYLTIGFAYVIAAFVVLLLTALYSAMTFT